MPWSPERRNTFSRRTRGKVADLERKTVSDCWESGQTEGQSLLVTGKARLNAPSWRMFFRQLNS